MDKEFTPPVCRDYTDGQGNKITGCGQRIKILKKDDGKTEICEPFQVASFDREGNFEYRFVPHWIVCPNKRNDYEQWMEKKADDEARFFASKGNGGNRGGGPQKANKGYSGTRTFRK